MIEWRTELWIGGGNNSVDPRFVSHFSIFYLPSPSRASLFRIFSTILQNHVSNFPPPIRDAIPSVIESTSLVYEELVRSFVATPMKFHYVFSLRDLSRIVQSLLQTTPERFDTIERFLRVWTHECRRVFADRFIDSKDHDLFDQLLRKMIESHPLWKEHRPYLFRQPVLYGDYRTALRYDEANIYEDLQDYPAIKALFDEILQEFQEQFRYKDIVLFDEALEHVTRIYRVLRLDRGHVLLMGAGGSGKQLLSKLAAFAAHCQLFEIQLTRNYNEQAFREDLKQLFLQVGVKNSPTVFLLTDTQIVDESFLEYMNNILSNGIVPALFNDEVKFPSSEIDRAMILGARRHFE